MKSQMCLSQRRAESVQTSIKETHTHACASFLNSAWGVCLFARGVCVCEARRSVYTHTYTFLQSISQTYLMIFPFYLSFESSHERTRASVLISQVKHDYDLLMLKLRSLVDIFHSFSQRWEFSCIAPHGINIFISACVSAFKTFPPAVWKIFLISHPYGAQKSP